MTERNGQHDPSAEESFRIEVVPIDHLTPHPRNYVSHPEDEIEHICQSLREHGLYKNVVVARDYTILAGHGVVEAARRLEYAELPVVRLDLDPSDNRALKVLAGDNEIAHLRQIDDRALTVILKDIMDGNPENLAGTGYDDKMLAALVMVTRHEAEIKDLRDAALWAGMPEYAPDSNEISIIVRFDTEERRKEFIAKSGLSPTYVGRTCSAWYPPRERADLTGIKIEA